MRRFADMRLQRKLTLIILATCGVVMLLAGGAMFIFQSVSFKQNYIRDMNSLARMFSDSSTAAIVFNDAKSAEETLGALKGEPRVIGAEIRLSNGDRLARYGREAVLPQADRDKLADPKGGRFAGGYYFLTHPVELDGKRVGTLCMWTHYKADYEGLLRLYLTVIPAGLAVCFGLLYMVSSRLQGFITQPILRLAETARVVARNNDYSVRAKRIGLDEVGQLTEAFNRMLDRVEAQDAALRLSEQQFASLVNSVNGIVWEADPATLNLLFVSPQVEMILGEPWQTWVENPQLWQERRFPEDQERAVEALRQFIPAGKPFHLEYRMLHVSGNVLWFHDNITVLMRDGRPDRLRGVTTDITAEKLAGEKLAEAQKQLVAASRSAGMAEVATGVLHNVGNVLTSINVSTQHVREKLRQSELASLVKVSSMLEAQNGGTSDFLANDPKGKLIPGFLIQLTRALQGEHEILQREHEQLARNVEHIKEIVARQQTYARVTGVLEDISLQELVEDSLNINGRNLEERGITVVREFAVVAPFMADKHKILQILVNLVNNAIHALDGAGSGDRVLSARIALSGENRVAVAISDNGVGIPRENLTRIFSHGFTTRKTGHGFGLHSGAIDAKEMGGSLKAASPGPGKGATFTLELPLDGERTPV